MKFFCLFEIEYVNLKLFWEFSRKIIVFFSKFELERILGYYI